MNRVIAVSQHSPASVPQNFRIHPFSLIAPKDQPLPLSLATIRTTIIINATVVGRPTNRMCRWLQIVSSMSSFILRLRTRIILSLHKQLPWVAVAKSLKLCKAFELYQLAVSTQSRIRVDSLARVSFILDPPLQ